MESGTTREAFDATAGGDIRDPWGPLAELRRSAGILKGSTNGGTMPGSENVDSWTVLRFDDCARVLRDTATFSSRVYTALMGPVMGRTILEMDEPEHRLHRALAGKAFRQKTLERWEQELIAPLAQELVSGFAGRGEAELVRDLSFPFPVQVIARILGLPRADYPEFQRLAFALTSVASGYEVATEASRQLADYLLPFIRERRVDPGDDLISELATGEVDGQRLTDEEIVSYLRLLLPAGSETTYCSIGSLLIALLENPDQLDDVRRDRSLIGPAIEELLRWEPAVPFIPRLVTTDTAICDTAIKAGSIVTVALGSANRDETHFPDPDRFDLHRQGQPHLAFSSGPHMCLGMHLARTEMRIVLDTLLDTIPDMELAPGPPGSDTADPHIHGVGFRSATCVPVRFTPALSPV